MNAIPASRDTLPMLIIDYNPVEFPEKFGAALARPNTLRCTWSDLVWSAITVGRKHLQYVIRPETYAYFELVHRATSLYAYWQAADYRPGLWGPADTHLRQSPAYQHLGPAEKSANSYFLGLTAAKLFAEKLLNTPWLLHVDTYSRHIEADLSWKLPDLVGLDRQLAWLVLEVKGRSNWLDQRVVKKAKQQAQTLTRIAGCQPGLQVGFCSYFTGITKTFKVYLVDPPVKDKLGNGNNLDLTLETYLSAYYGLVFDTLTAEYGGESTAVTYRKHTYRVKSIAEADLQLGLDEQIYALLQSGDKSLSKNMATGLSDVTSPSDEDEAQTTVGYDGIYVRLGDSWRDDKMYLSPAERR
ncbi:hypothetical protein ACFLXQ_08395 [Chloroflexota bacterium]